MICENCKNKIELLDGPGTYRYDYINHTFSHIHCLKQHKKGAKP